MGWNAGDPLASECIRNVSEDGSENIKEREY